MESSAKLSTGQKPQPDLRLNAVFERVETFARARGLKVQVTSAKNSNILATVPYETKLKLATSLESWIESYELLGATHINVSTDVQALKTYTQKFGFRIDQDFYSTLRDGECVEAYEFTSDLTGAIQSWRNWKFLQLSSYDTVSLTFSPMHELFHREPEIQAAIDRLVLGLIGEPKTKLSHIRPHVLTEIRHQHNRQFSIDNRFVAPMFDDWGRVIGFVSSLSAKPLGSAYADSNVQPLLN